MKKTKATKVKGKLKNLTFKLKTWSSRESQFPDCLEICRFKRWKSKSLKNLTTSLSSCRLSPVSKKTIEVTSSMKISKMLNKALSRKSSKKMTMTVNHREVLHNRTLKMRKNLMKGKWRKVKIKKNRRKLEDFRNMKGSQKQKENIKSRSKREKRGKTKSQRKSKEKWPKRTE